jgi:hypothetical protein
MRQVTAAVALCGLVSAFARYISVDNSPEELLRCTISAIEGELTVYTIGYKEFKFRSLRVGMTVSQVEDIMGPPLARSEWARIPGNPEGDVWSYTRPYKPHGDYWTRGVFFRDGIISYIQSEYYTD